MHLLELLWIQALMRVRTQSDKIDAAHAELLELLIEIERITKLCILLMLQRNFPSFNHIWSL